MPDLHDNKADYCLWDVVGELDQTPFLETLASLVEHAVEDNNIAIQYNNTIPNLLLLLMTIHGRHVYRSAVIVYGNSMAALTTHHDPVPSHLEEAAWVTCLAAPFPAVTGQHKYQQ